MIGRARAPTGGDEPISFSPAGVLQLNSGAKGDGGTPASDGATEASEPSGALTLFDAVTKQLGLKLEMQKRPIPVLVIEHIERKPIEN